MMTKKWIAMDGTVLDSEEAVKFHDCYDDGTNFAFADDSGRVIDTNKLNYEDGRVYYIRINTPAGKQLLKRIIDDDPVVSYFSGMLTDEYPQSYMYVDEMTTDLALDKWSTVEKYKKHLQLRLSVVDGVMTRLGGVVDCG